MARFPHHSFGNVMLIANQRPDATFVAGFHAWKKLGRFVKKGEKGIRIVAPIVSRKETENDGSLVKGFESSTSSPSSRRMDSRFRSSRKSPVTLAR